MTNPIPRLPILNFRSTPHAAVHRGKLDVRKWKVGDRIHPVFSGSSLRYTIIENGLAPSGMPASKGIRGDDDMWIIVAYLRHLPPAGSLGERRTYPDERQVM